jgi:uncharacterized protein with PIN domain
MELTDAIVAIISGESEPASQIELESGLRTPFVDSPLIQEHVAIFLQRRGGGHARRTMER